MAVGGGQRAGRVEIACALDVELLPLDEPAELRLELGLREAGRGEERRQVGADLRGVAADLARRPRGSCRSVVWSSSAAQPCTQTASSTTTRIASATSPASRRSGVIPCGALKLRPPWPTAAARAVTARWPRSPGAETAQSRASRRRRSRSRGCRRRARSRWSPPGPVTLDEACPAERPDADECTGDSAAKDVPLVRRRMETGVVRCLRTSRPSARPRPLSPPEAARSRRLRLGLARARRAHRPRGRAEDRSAGRASGRRVPRARWRQPRGCATSAACGPTTSAATPATSTSPTSTCVAARCARRSASEELDDARGGRGRRPDPRRARARAPKRDRPPRRQAVERPRRGERRDLRARARLRARAVRRGRHAHGRRRRPRHARVHLARAAGRRGGLGAQRRLGGRRDPLGGARGQPSVLGRPAAGGGEHDRLGSAAAVGPPRRPPTAPARRDRRCPRGRSRQASDGRPPRRGPPGGLRRGTPSAPDEPTPTPRGRPPRSPVRERQSRPVPLERRLAPAGLAAVATLVGGVASPVLAGLRARGARGRRRGHDAPRAAARARARRSQRPCSRSGTSPRRRRSSTAPSRSPGSRSPGATRERACSSAPGRSSRRSACSRSCRSPCSRRAERGGVRCTPASGVLAAAAVAGLSGSHCRSAAAPSAISGSPGASAPTDVLHALGTVRRRRDRRSRPRHSRWRSSLRCCRGRRARGHWGVAGLGALQLTLVFAWAPSIPWPGFVLGTWLLCGLLAARPSRRGVRT